MGVIGSTHSFRKFYPALQKSFSGAEFFNYGSHGSGERTPLACWFRRLSRNIFEKVFGVRPRIAQPSHASARTLGLGRGKQGKQR
jgi:hypothetical protein